MGKPSSQPQSSINHCSHPHPLQISNPQPYQTLSLPPCSACKLTLSESIYSCTTCNYHLHLKCSQTPHQITHSFHQKHHLNLLTTPAYPCGFFNCDACGKQGNGFSYHCKACEIDLHSTCASMPVHVTSPYHNHQLSLLFSSPYPNKSFSCHVCKNIGSKWLYRCNLCGFDVHLNCATTTPDQGHVMGIPTVPNPGLQNYGSNLGVNGFQGAVARNYAEEQAVMLQKLQNISNNASAHTQQDIFQAILGGMAGGAAGAMASGSNPYLQSQSTLGSAGGGGGNPALDALMAGNGGGGNPVLNALMGGGGGGGNPMLNALMGGGAAGGNPTLNALMGGGGGGIPVLNALMGGGGGGGGSDVLNAMTGGGGGGSFDFSSLGGALGGLGGFGL